MRVLKRFVVSEDSMRPTLEPGDGVVAIRTRRPRRGDVCVFTPPGSPDRWYVKRVVGVAGDEVVAAGRRWDVERDEMFVVSDHRAVTRADSRTWGPIPVGEVYRMVWRVPSARPAR